MRLIVAVLPLAIASAAHPASATDQAEQIHICTEYSKLAGMVMKLRQSGGLLSDALATQQTDPSPIIQQIIEGAFDQPQYSGEDYREQAIADYSNEVMSACLKGLRSAPGAAEPKP